MLTCWLGSAWLGLAWLASLARYNSHGIHQIFLTKNSSNFPDKKLDRKNRTLIASRNVILLLGWNHGTAIGWRSKKKTNEFYNGYIILKNEEFKICMNWFHNILNFSAKLNFGSFIDFLNFLTCLRMQHTLLEYNLENQQIQCHIYHTNLLKYCLCSWNTFHQHHSSIVWSHEDYNNNLGRNIM